jgi:hypothetical protein
MLTHPENQKAQKQEGLTYFKVFPRLVLKLFNAYGRENRLNHKA